MLFQLLGKLGRIHNEENLEKREAPVALARTRSTCRLLAEMPAHLTRFLMMFREDPLYPDPK